MKTCPICDTAYPNEYTTCGKDGARLVAAAELEPGTLIRGKYRILRMLGQGGMGTVYLAEHMLLRRQQALKFMSGELSRDSRFLKRFRHEAQAAIQLRHPNIVEVVDLDQAEDGTPYIAMEYVEGRDLRDLLAVGRLPVERALTIARGVALGLEAAHAKGIVHRDLKPENILLAENRSEAETPKLADFGIAAMNDTAAAMSRTRALMLTPEYAAPEQWRGIPSQELDGRTDLYAMGGMLYEMLTGRGPFDARTPEGWMYEHLQTQPAAPSSVRPELKNWRGLDALVLGLLAKDRDARTPSAAALVDALDAVRFVRTESRRVPEPESPVFRPPDRRPSAQATSLPRAQPRIVIAAPAALAEPVDAGETDSEPEPVSPAFRWVRMGVLAMAVLAVVIGVLCVALPVDRIDTLAQRMEQAGHSELAIPVFQLVCTRGGGHGCTWLGVQYFSGAIGPSNAAKALEYFARGCDDGDPAGCLNAGQAYELGQGVTPSFSRAVDFYERDCNRDDANGCANLGRMYERGNGVAQDYAHALALFARSCEQNSAEGCEGLARSYRDGHGVRTDLKMAGRLFEKSRLLGER